MSTKPKHTPGLWTWNRYQDNKGYGVRVSMGQKLSFICVAALDRGRGRTVAASRVLREIEDEEQDEIRANARLIAAAPEMLEALRAFQRNIQENGHGPSTQALLDQVDDAIAKAEGRS